MVQTKLGVIGGSGVYQLDGSKLIAQHKIETPFGSPSDVILEVECDGKSVYFLPRHGAHHSLLPSEVNYRANIYAMKSLGVNCLLAVSAVGIMKKNIRPGDMVVPDQIFDRTKGIRPSTFFGDGIVGHVTFADPFCETLRAEIFKAASKHTNNAHNSGVYVCMEGPQFSTRAESKFYRHTLEPAVIGMTAIPEAKLAREAEMSYGMLALATDYDCWNENEDDVSVEAVMKILRDNSELAKKIVRELATQLPEKWSAEALDAAKFAIMTPIEFIPEKTKERLSALYGKYFAK